MIKTNTLIILDGFGYSEQKYGNAIAEEGIPNFLRLWNEFPHTLISASGRRVGLPDGQMGNSEVGHLNIGSGRVVYQDITRIDKSIEDGEFFENEPNLTKLWTLRLNITAECICAVCSETAACIVR